MTTKYEIIEEKYSFVDYLGEVPYGWLDLVDKMFAEIEAHGGEFNLLQIKEKYGSLRVYWYGDESLTDIVNKYEDLSESICCGCGKPATVISYGWICPWCDECAEKIGGKFRRIDHD